jgi:uncharacterized protein YciI
MHIALPARIAFATLAILALLSSVIAPIQAQEKKMPEFRYVVVHRPGPNWKAGVPAFEQAGLQAHVEYFASLLKAGRLTMGGPFMDEASGGMMIPEAGVSESEIRTFAAQDPAVKSGLLVFEVRPWMPALHK